MTSTSDRLLNSAPAGAGSNVIMSRAGTGQLSDRQRVPRIPGCVYEGRVPLTPARPDKVMTTSQRRDSGTFVEKVTLIMLAARGADELCAICRVSNCAAYTNMGSDEPASGVNTVMRSGQPTMGAVGSVTVTSACAPTRACCTSTAKSAGAGCPMRGL